MRLIGLDLYHGFLQTMERYVHVRNRDYTDQMRQQPDDQAVKDAYAKHTIAVNDWRTQLDRPYDDVDAYNFRASLRRALPTTSLDRWPDQTSRR